jgi:hypothetical protein
MSVPSFIDDGNFSTAQQNGPGWWTLPFMNRGDSRTFEFHAKFRQSAASYVPYENQLAGVLNTPPPLIVRENPQWIQTARGKAYLVEESETSDVGCGILEFTRTYAGLPETRTEPSSIVYPFQFIKEGGTEGPEVAEMPIPVQAFMVFEYSLQPLPVIRAPRVFQVFNSLKYILTPPENGFFVARDSENSLHRGYFYERKTCYVEMAPFSDTPT